MGTDEHGQPVRVVILERDPLLWTGLRSILRPVPRVEVVGDFTRVRDGLPAMPVPRPDLLLVNGGWLRESPSGLPAREGEPWPELPMVAVLDAGDRETLRRAVLTRSVRGFVDRNTSHEDLGTAVLGAVEGRTFLSSSVARSLVEWMAARMDPEPASFAHIETLLTGREMEIFEAMGDGITNTVIARRLGIQEATVRSHIYRILGKLNLRTRTEAALTAYKYTRLDSRCAG